MNFEQNDVAVLIVFGQSNAHGHGTRLPQAQQITTPLQHVWGLPAAENQAYGLPDVTWSGFTTCDMNLGETQNHTFCLAERFARLWQEKIDSCNLYSLPDLYVIQISIGGQGVHAVERDGLNMWYPKRPPVLLPGNPGEVNISLYPLATEILHLSMCNLKRSGKNPRIIGLHWNQWETEVDTAGEALLHAEENYRGLFAGFREALGVDYPLFLYRPLSELYEKPRELQYMDSLICDFAKGDKHVHLLDLSQSCLYSRKRADKGIFQDDCIHYSPAAHDWFAYMQFMNVLNVANVLK